MNLCTDLVSRFTGYVTHSPQCLFLLPLERKKENLGKKLTTGNRYTVSVHDQTKALILRFLGESTIP